MLFLGLKKVTQASDISPEIFEQNADIFVDYIYMFFNSFMIEVSITRKPFHSFVTQINRLVSI